MKRFVLALLALVLVAGPAFAMDRIPPGVDLFTTRANGSTFMNFTSNPIPAGFFCPGSAPFTGRVEFHGLPIAGAPGRADTIIERIDEAQLNDRGVGGSRIRIRAVQLESEKAISTSCGDYILRASLSNREQPISRMRIRQTEADGGFFTATLALNLRLSFHPVSGRGGVRVLEDTISFNRSTQLPWAVAIEGEGVSRPVTVDTNADGRPDTRLTLSSSFIAGRAPGIDKVNGGGLIGAPAALISDQDDPGPIYHSLPEHGHYVEPICGDDVFVCP